ncbi:ribosome maturation factor RimP [Dehalobacterium formicoaceticum]|uniref:Ribosome maturation factor RimP n=1 Tax=Dehalobacterium formicoaceticum TaxID=51515 RepID=A0ABT1Y886_9FIRM|nr:ribosome maturation factor RimP [Dehalobacterium formicoaceticum]MCR6545891.1 ribosome maturation factor RimP [Dehalobacterium formicoaceticum]
MQKNSSVKETVENILRPLVESAGYDLVDLEYKKEGGNWYLRLFIDHDNGIDHTACEQVSNLVGDELDQRDPIPHSYILEVSSPGIERPLKTAKDFVRFSGEKVHIKLFAAKNKQKEFIGILLGMEDHQVALATDSSKILFDLDEIASAQLIVDFN